MGHVWRCVLNGVDDTAENDVVRLHPAAFIIPARVGVAHGRCALGRQDHDRLAAGETMSAKQRKALALRAKGQDIELLGEDDFLRSL